jgi:hypothetical protein
MKRSWIKRTSKPLKRTRIKKTSKQSISVIQRKLWEECKRIIREQFGNTCYTCGAKNLSGSNLHTGHLWAKASLGAYLKYDIRVLRPQCYRCNIHLGGAGADFYKKMLRTEGEDYMKRLEADRNITVKAYDHYLSLLEEYKNIRI